MAGRPPPHNRPEVLGLFGPTVSGKTAFGARSIGIADRVHFVGHVHDPWASLVDADVLVHASTIPEPFGQVVVVSNAPRVGCSCRHVRSTTRVFT